ncbi:MAG: zinc ribbon domain-containing protein [Kiritimatiellae bacterium]|nr:zinc ribbon domain-containing protein [Kiritimatiellia bacterium]
MPIYEYQANDDAHACNRCKNGFEHLHRTTEAPLTQCPECGALVHKLISAPSVGSSASGLDDRAKNAGFHKLKKLGKGEYEKQY